MDTINCVLMGNNCFMLFHTFNYIQGSSKGISSIPFYVYNINNITVNMSKTVKFDLIHSRTIVISESDLTLIILL